MSNSPLSNVQEEANLMFRTFTHAATDQSLIDRKALLVSQGELDDAHAESLRCALLVLISQEISRRAAAAAHYHGDTQ